MSTDNTGALGTLGTLPMVTKAEGSLCLLPVSVSWAKKGQVRVNFPLQSDLHCYYIIKSEKSNQQPRLTPPTPHLSQGCIQITVLNLMYCSLDNYSQHRYIFNPTFVFIIYSYREPQELF